MNRFQRTYQGRPLPYPDEPVFDQGLVFDLGTVRSRRQTLRLFGAGAGAMLLAACGGEATSSSTSGSAGTCSTEIPEETAGPYPGDGSNGPDVLSQSGVVREDIRSSFGESSGTADGVRLDIELAVVDMDNECVPFAGAAVYLWQCDRSGDYSMYSDAVLDQNYLRGVQAAGDDGIVRFTSIFPGCYSGRWPHIHFEVFGDLDSATDVSNKIATSQIALPADISGQVYDSVAGYEASQGTFAGITLASDNVFGEDEGASQLGTVSGSVESGLAVRLEVPISLATEPGSGDSGPGGGGPGGPPPS